MKLMTEPDEEAILSLVRISCCVAIGDEDRLRDEFQKATARGLALPLIREAVLQTYLFAGYAAAINAFIVLNEICPGNQEFWRESAGSLQHWQERGEELCRKIYASQYEKLIQNMNELHPDLAEWMIWEGYGKVLGRPFLSPLVRELLIVAMTAVLQVQRQFHSHVRGAINAGASPEQLRSIFGETKRFIAQDVFEHYQLILHGLIRA